MELQAQVLSTKYIDQLREWFSALMNEINGLHHYVKSSTKLGRTAEPVTDESVREWEGVYDRISHIQESFLEHELESNTDFRNQDSYVLYLKKLNSFLQDIAEIDITQLVEKVVFVKDYYRLKTAKNNSIQIKCYPNLLALKYPNLVLSPHQAPIQFGSDEPILDSSVMKAAELTSTLVPSTYFHQTEADKLCHVLLKLHSIFQRVREQIVEKLSGIPTVQENPLRFPYLLQISTSSLNQQIGIPSGDVPTVSKNQPKSRKEETRRIARRAISYFEDQIKNIVQREKGKKNPLSDKDVLNEAISGYRRTAQSQRLAGTERGLNRYLRDIGEETTIRKYGGHLVRQERIGK